MCENINENIDLRKILKGCPEDGSVELYSTVHGKCKFSRIDTVDKYYPIKVERDNAIFSFRANGYYYQTTDGECILFPSESQRDWSKFERFWVPKRERFSLSTLKPFDKLLVRLTQDSPWRCGLFSHISEDDFGYKKVHTTAGFCVAHCIPYNEETKHLVGATDDCPDYYQWWLE